jgi:hypothetical protein
MNTNSMQDKPVPWHHRILKDQPDSDPKYWTDSLRLKYVTEELEEYRLAFPNPLAEPVQPEHCDPSSSILGLAEMILSDCGCSSNHQPLLNRVAARIQGYIDTPPAAAPVQEPFVWSVTEGGAYTSGEYWVSERIDGKGWNARKGGDTVLLADSIEACKAACERDASAPVQPEQEPVTVTSINLYELVRAAFDAGIKNDFKALDICEKQVEQFINTTPPAAAVKERMEVLDRIKEALPEFRQQDDYLLAHGASLLSEQSHEIIHVDTALRIAGATPPAAPAQPEQEPVAGVVLRDGCPTLIQDKHIKETDQRLCILPTTQPAQPAPTGKAPCAQHCEATAFQITIRGLKGDIERMKAAAAAQPAAREIDPCPGCRKGGVCKTPECGRLKLPREHPYRTGLPAQPAPQPAQQEPTIAACIIGADAVDKKIDGYEAAKVYVAMQKAMGTPPTTCTWTKAPECPTPTTPPVA